MLLIVRIFAIALLATAASESFAQPLPPVRYTPPKLDPAKAEVARSVAVHLLPAGWTAEWLKESMGLASVIHNQLMMPVERFAKEHGATLPEEGQDGPPMVRLRLLAILDPASVERLSVISPIVEKMAADIAASGEPQLREAMAIAYGERLSVTELQALDRFLATPEGTAFARANNIIWNDLGVLAAQQSIGRAIEGADPAMTRRILDATRSLPKIRGAADLSDAERIEVAKLLKLDPSKLKQ